MHFETLNLLDWISLVCMIVFIGMTVIVKISQFMAPPTDDE
jgi:hypothetical protein